MSSRSCHSRGLKPITCIIPPRPSPLPSNLNISPLPSSSPPTTPNDYHLPPLHLHNLPVSPPLPLPPPPSPSPPLTPHRTLDPLFALTIGIAAAGIRIRREESEKRAGISTTSIVSPQKPMGERKGGEEMVGFREIGEIGWGRLWKKVTGELG